MKIYRLPDTLLFNQVKKALGGLSRKSKTIEFVTEKKSLGYLGMTGTIHIYKVTSTGVAETWGGWWRDDEDNIDERDVTIGEDVCYIELVRLGGQAYIYLYVNPVHEGMFK